VRADGVARYDGIAYAVLPGVRPLLMDLWVPSAEQPPPVVVWIHGGAWREGDRRYLPPTMPHESLFEKVVAAGLALATIDYRLSGEAPFPAQLHDVKAAIRYLRHYAAPLHVDGARVGVGGESAGGHLAALAALTGDAASELEGDVGVVGPSSTVSCAAPWYGLMDARPLDLSDPDDVVAALLGGRTAELAERASPVHYVTAGAPPFLLLHGELDAVVPIDQSARLHAALQSAGARSEFVPVPGADHCFDGYPDVDGLLDRTVAFWRRQLVAAAAGAPA
jgi:acetyl esterase/lipase